jgi:hypothetical protein
MKLFVWSCKMKKVSGKPDCDISCELLKQIENCINNFS